MPRRPTIIAAGLCATLLGLAVAAWATSARRDQRVPRALVTSESIVMLGDSITEQGPWESAFPDLSISNQGYAGFTTAQLVDVASEVAMERPRAVYVLTGTNDIRDRQTPSWTVQHLATILDEFASTTPRTRVIVQTILPRAVGSNEVRATNAAIKRLAADRGIEVLDLHPVFDDGSGALRPADTDDGIHLSNVGNEVWADLLRDDFVRR